jgi:hypothetical protein
VLPLLNQPGGKNKIIKGFIKIDQKNYIGYKRPWKIGCICLTDAWHVLKYFKDKKHTESNESILKIKYDLSHVFFS